MEATPAVEEIFISEGLVYVAGVEFPVTDIYVTYGEGIIPQATFTVPGDSELERLGEEDKVPVAMFYLDQWYSASNRESKIEPTYCLLFDGEITGWGYGKSSYGRSITFTATGFINVMSQMFAQFLRGDATSHASNTQMNLNTQQGIPVPLPKYFPYTLYQKGLFSGGGSKTIDRPFDFVENLLLPMKLGGFPTYTGASEGKKIAVNSDGSISNELRILMVDAEKLPRIPTGYYNDFVLDIVDRSAPMDFFVKHNHKVKFDKRWVATKLERFFDADRFTQSDNIEDPRFRQVIASIIRNTHINTLENLFGDGGSFFQMLNIFYSSVIYEILMLPIPPYLNVGDRSSNTERGIPIANSNTKTEKRLGNYISKPVEKFPLAPACNILFPSLAKDINYEESYSTQPTRTVAGSPYYDYNVMKNSTESVDLQRRLSTVNCWPLALKQKSDRVTTGNINNILLYPEEYFKGPVINHITMPPWYTYLSEGVGKFENDNKVSLSNNNKKASRGEQKTGKDPKADKSVSDDQNINSDVYKANDEALASYRYDIRNDNSVYTRYTRLKYYEARYGARNGTINSMPFNPYIIPSYPFVYPGDDATSFALTGNVNSVSHNISSQSGMSTSISYSFARTLKEDFEVAIQEYIDDIDRRKAKGETNPTPDFHATSPIQPVAKIAKELQVVENASEYYRNIFYQGASISKDTVFDYKKFFVTTEYKGKQMPTSRVIPRNPSDGYEVKLDQSSKFDVHNKSYSKAMQYVSRPVCTLQEYIEFINGGASTSYYKSNIISAEKYGVEVPAIIKDYLAEPNTGNNNNANVSKLNRYISPRTTPTSEILDLRRDWVKRIKNYRRKVHNKEIQR